MIQEIVHVLLQRILHDRIVQGLIVIGILAAVMGGMGSQDEPPVSRPKAVEAEHAANGNPVEQSSHVEPRLAQDFIKWWLGLAMDFSPGTAAQSHQQAFAWMSQDAMLSFQSAYWNHEMANGIADGRIVASFQPSSIRARALNPDGSVVVGVEGTYFVQAGGKPVPYQVRADFLVRRAKDGLRVAGVCNQLAAVPGSSVY